MLVPGGMNFSGPEVIASDCVTAGTLGKYSAGNTVWDLYFIMRRGLEYLAEKSQTAMKCVHKSCYIHYSVVLYG